MAGWVVRRLCSCLGGRWAALAAVPGVQTPCPTAGWKAVVQASGAAASVACLIAGLAVAAA